MKSAVAALLLFALPLALVAQAPRKKDGKRAVTATVRLGPGKQLMRQVLDAWGTLDLTRVAPYYSSDPNSLFFDILPLKYTGWQQYAEGVKKVFADVQSAKFTLNDDAQVHRFGNIAYGAATWHGEFLHKDSSKDVMDGRWTVVWEQRGSDWRIVHDHFSVPLSPSEKK